MSVVRTSGVISSMTWMLVAAGWTRIPRDSEWIAALVAL